MALLIEKWLGENFFFFFMYEIIGREFVWYVFVGGAILYLLNLRVPFGVDISRPSLRCRQQPIGLHCL